MDNLLSYYHCFEGDIRLVNSRLEIFYNFVWGTVCDDLFGDINAHVACKQLGYSTGVSLGSDVDDGSGRIWLDNVNCAGNEQKLMYCSHEEWGSGNCNHNEDVGIYCFNSTAVGINETFSRSITQSDLEGNYSLGVVVGVGVGCIIVTIILVLLSQYAFSRWKKFKGGT
ncbi:macrophage receptor MARCO-like [Mytilus galloprovincialis]|uniref:macrophage receptor MARCO-like n=1 Tax=Mytilus galloprovincialis TaxID=29158 RepID=UPI003F7C9F95